MRVRVSDVKLEYCGSGVDAFVINGNLLKAQTLYVSIIKNMLFKQEKQTASILYTNAFIVYINNLRICANRKKHMWQICARIKYAGKEAIPSNTL